MVGSPLRVKRADNGGVGRVTGVHYPQTIAAIRRVHSVAHHLKATRACVVRGAEQTWVSWVSHVDDGHQVVGHVCGVAHHLHVPGISRRSEGAGQGRACWIAHVQDQQTRVSVSHIGIVPLHINTASCTRCVVAAHFVRIRRVRHIHHLQPAVLPVNRGDHVGIGAGDGDCLGVPSAVEAA